MAQPVALSLPKFYHVLTKNGENGENEVHEPVEDIGFALFPVQLESLTWMKQQERSGGVPFMLEHSEEAIVLSSG